MKTVNYLILSFLLMSTFACRKTVHDCEKITLEIKNELDSDLENFHIYTMDNGGSYTFDKLKSGESIEDLCFDQMNVDFEFPLVYFTATVDGREVKSTAHQFFCGIGIIAIDEGQYKIELQAADFGVGDFIGYQVIE